MEEVTFGQYGLPIILTIIMGVAYKFVNITDKYKALICIGIGMGLGLLALAYNELAWTVPNIVDYALYGFMSGASAVGLYEGVYRTATNPRK